MGAKAADTETPVVDVAEEAAFADFFAEASGKTPEEKDPSSDDEAARLAAEEKEAAVKAEAEKAEADRLAAEQAEKEKGDEAERQRVAAEKEAADKAEADRLAAEKAEADRVAAEASAFKIDEKFKEDWPEHAALIEAVVKQNEELKKSLVEQIAQIQQFVNPLAMDAETRAQQAHETAILSVHKDAFDLVPEIEKWIATQPSYLQPAYKAVIESGTAAQINDFLTQYKTATGKLEQKQEERQEERQEEDTNLRHLTPVKSRRTVDTEGVDPEDFNGAFQKAAAALK